MESSPPKKTIDTSPDAEEEETPVIQIPDMSVCQNYFNYEYYWQISQKGLQQDEEGKSCDVEMKRIQSEIMGKIKTHKMAPFYEIICDRLKWTADEALLAELKAANEEEAKKYDEQEAEAEKNAGEMEVLDALFDRAAFWCRIGARSQAYKALDAIVARPKVSAGKRLDATMTKTRLAFFYNDLSMVKKCLAAAEELGELGGDWDRLNRLKVYRAFYLLLVRDVKKIVDGPEVLSVIRDMPAVGKLVNSLYECTYREFFEAMVALSPRFQRDRLLRTHVRYLVREMRLLAYTQFLEAYKSVILASMATSFGVSPAFLDTELSRFIAAGRLNAKIDKVEGVVETNRPDKKNAQYQALIKQGDLLLNRVQRLTRVIDV